MTSPAPAKDAQRYSAEPAEISALVRQARSGNRDAFTRLYEQFKKVVYTAILSRVSDKEDAMDMTQETFMIAFERLHTLENDEKFGSWVYGIGSHLAVNHVQRGDRKKRSALPNELPARAAAGAPPLQELEKSVWDSIHALPERYHVPLLLRYMEKMPPRDIADKTGLSYGSVRVILCEGTKMLREKLKPLLTRTER